MTKPYVRTFRARWSETNAIGQVELAAYLRYLIETAWDWGATSGLSMAENEALGLAWIILENEITINRPLAANDIFDFTIWLAKWRRIRGTRCFEIRLKDRDELVAQGAQQVAVLDSKTFRPVRVPQHLIDGFIMQNPPVIEQRSFPKFQPRPETAFIVQRDVEWRDLDSLEHVNNATYASYAENAAVQALAAVGWAPSQFKARALTVVNRRLHIQYQSPALWGDTLDVAVHLMELKSAGGAWFIEITRASNNESITQCVLEWSLVNHSGEQQPLPETLFHALNLGNINDIFHH